MIYRTILYRLCSEIKPLIESKDTRGVEKAKQLAGDVWSFDKILGNYLRDLSDKFDFSLQHQESKIRPQYVHDLYGKSFRHIMEKIQMSDDARLNLE